MMSQQNILFFADRLPPLPGGMEVHASYFIEHFTSHPKFPLSGVITKNAEGRDCLVSESEEERHSINIKDLSDIFAPTFVFFNSGRWIEELRQIRKMFPRAIFLYRTGGNEILKAPLAHKQIPDHSLRQSYWVENLNNSIDLLITNSAYTETRLRDVGVTCPFARCVGGVNTSALRSSELPTRRRATIFCAARFVPYKNHSLLLSVIHELVLRGHDLRIRLAGDGPLLAQAKEQVLRDDLASVVEFLGVLDNRETCQEIACADVYMQLSADRVTEVPGGSYVHSEGMGRSVLEALTAGTFVVAGRSGALSEIVTEDRGLLVDLDTLERITDQIEQVLRPLPVRQPFLDDFSWTKIFKRYEGLLGNVS
jgi:glycosyltransferase involved in cell wall biosynthesis